MSAFLIVVILIMLSAHTWLFFAFRSVFSITQKSHQIILGIVFLFLSFSFILSSVLIHRNENFFTNSFYLFASFWLGLLVNLLIATICFCLIVNLLKLFGHEPHKLAIGILFLACALLYSGYGVWKARNPEIKNILVAVEDLPTQWKNKKIVQLSDVHLGRIWGKNFLEKITQKVNDLEPDIIVITGDLFDGIDGNLETFIEPLNKLQAKNGVFYVNGNHEIYLGFDKVLGILEKTDINVLDDKIIEVDGLQIIGISYPGFNEPKNGKEIILSQENFDQEKPSILLYHTPTDIGDGEKDGLDWHIKTYWSPKTYFKTAKELGIDLQLSGHAHKGQIFPFGYLTGAIYNGFDYGLHRDGNFAIYTTSGVGTWGPPMRTGSASEIVVITLK